MMVGWLISVLYKDGPSALCITTRLGGMKRSPGDSRVTVFFFYYLSGQFLVSWKVRNEAEKRRGMEKGCDSMRCCSFLLD